jgi:hypothetical protein
VVVHAEQRHATAAALRHRPDEHQPEISGDGGGDDDEIIYTEWDIS